MPKRTARDNIMMRPLPSTRVPWLVILLLATAIVLIYLGFLRPPDKLLGPPLPENRYLQQLPADTAPPAQPAPGNAAP